jgi:hypothetical protein
LIAEMAVDEILTGAADDRIAGCTADRNVAKSGMMLSAPVLSTSP